MEKTLIAPLIGYQAWWRQCGGVGQNLPHWTNRRCHHWRHWRYQDEILQSVTVPYLQRLDLNPSEHLWGQLGCAVCARVMVLLHAAEAPVC